LLQACAYHFVGNRPWAMDQQMEEIQIIGKLGDLIGIASVDEGVHPGRQRR
jgi:hypothetical protein